VKKNHKLLRLNVGYIYNKPIGTSREIPIDIEKLEIEDLDIQELKSIVRVSKTREGLLLQVQAEAKVLTTCVRCLDEFYFPVRVAFDELYQFPSRYREETDLILPDDGFIDLNPLYREYLILSMPIKQICQTGCKGLCAVCGANLNETGCEHHPTANVHSGIIDDEEVA